MYKSNTTLSALQEEKLLDSTWHWQNDSWWDNFVNEVVVLNERWENFRLTRKKNLFKLKLPNIECKQPLKTPKNDIVWTQNILICFHVWTQNICSVFALN